MRRPALICGYIGLALSALPRPAFAADALQPFQLVRSLQLVQDRIAAGDHAALPMQRKLLEMVDARMRTAPPDAFKEAKNFRALLVYGMSGGNPVTVEAATSRLDLDAENRALASGIIAYLNGQPTAAITALAPIQPMQLPSDLGAFLALVKGSLLAADKPVEALALLDQARLLSPGSLVEEAALRRSIAIDAEQGDAARFALASTQYVENYLYSPYASQFADAFVNGVIGMHEAISQDKLADITSMMDAEREKVIYLRIARRAAIEGLKDLSAYASARAEQGRDGNGNENDPRALLYASLSTVTSATVDDLREKLKTIDRSQLSEGDQSLLDAAQAVVGEMIAVPKAPAPKHDSAAVAPRPADAKPAAPKSVAPEATEEASVASDLPAVEGAMAEMPVADAPAAPLPAPVSASESAPALENSEPAKAIADAADPTDTAIADARRRLESIDQMLGTSPE